RSVPGSSRLDDARMTARSSIAPVCADRVRPRTDGFPASDDAADIERVTRPRGEACFVLCSCLALMLVLHRTTIATLLAAWSRDPSGHGYFTVPGVGALAWTRRTQLAGLTPRPAPAALLLLAALSLVWFVGKAGDINAIQQVAVLAMCVGLAWAVLGAAAMRV